MIAQQPRFAVLAAAICVAWMGCQTRVQTPAGNPKGRPQAQGEARPKVVQAKVSEDSILVRLLTVETVQQDLGLTEDQIQKIRDIAKIGKERSQQFQAKMRDTLPPSGAFSPDVSEARQRELKKFCEDWRNRGKELRTQTLAMLTPSQSQRLKQIQLQVAIPAALGCPEIIKALELSEEQREKIRTLGQSMKENLSAELPSLDNLDPKELRQNMIELLKESAKAQAETNKQAFDLLRPEQRAKFEELLGKRIEVTWPYDTLIPEDAAF